MNRIPWLSVGLRQVPAILVWVSPLIVVLEYVGGSFRASLLSSTLFALLLFATAWGAFPPTLQAGAGRRLDSPLSWLVGAGLVATGLCLTLPAALSLLGHPDARQMFEALSDDGAWQKLLPVLGAWLLAVGWALCSGRRPGASDFERLGLLIAIVFLGMLAAGDRVQGLLVVAADTLAITGAALALCGLLLLGGLPFGVKIAVLLAFGLTLRAVGLEVWSPDPRTRDMLPLVLSAQDALLRGDPPYAIYQMQAGSQVPLTYLPGLWLASLPARLAGFDLRVTSMLADAAIVGALVWATRAVPAPHRKSARAVATAGAAVWLFSPSVQWNAVYAEPHPWWAVLALTIAALLNRRWWLGALLFGIALGTRQFAVALLPFAWLIYSRALGWREALARLGLAGATAAVLLVPFVVQDPEIFWFGTIRWLWEYGPAHANWFWYRLGFSGTLYQVDATEWMSIAQALGLAAMVLVAARVSTGRAIFAALGTAYVVMVMFNRIIWDSFYLGIAALLGPLVVGAAGLREGLGTIAAEADAERDSRAAEARPWYPARGLCGTGGFRASLILGWSLLGGALPASGWLAVSLYRSFDDTGRAAVVGELRRKVEPRDLLIDRSDRRLAFVGGRWLLERGEAPAQVLADPFHRSLAPRGPLGDRRIWLVTREDRDRELLAHLRLLAVDAQLLRFGRFQLLEVPSPGDGRNLTAALEGAELMLQQGHERPPQPLRQVGSGYWQGPNDASVRRRACVVGAGRWPSLAIERLSDTAVLVRWPSVKLGRRLLVRGGIEDRDVRWGRQGASAELLLAGQSLGTLRIANLPEMSWAVFGTEGQASERGSLALRIDSAEPRPRSVCVDVVAL